MKLPLRQDLADAEPQELLALYAHIVDELLERQVVRSSNNPVADYSEYLVARAFAARLVANANIGFDAIGDDDLRYQVKARRLTARNQSRQLGFIRGLDKDNDPFDVMVGILFNPDFTILRAALIPIEVIRARAARVDYVNGWRFILRDAVWNDAGVEDVTDRIRQASLARVAPPAILHATPASTVVPTADGAWRAALARYASPRALTTRARGQPFTVMAVSEQLVITPATGRARHILATEFQAAAPLIDTSSRRALQAVTFNSSYLEAVLDDLRSDRALSLEDSPGAIGR